MPRFLVILSDACGLGDFIMLRHLLTALSRQGRLTLVLPQRSLFKEQLLQEWGLDAGRISWVRLPEQGLGGRFLRLWQLFRLGWIHDLAILPFANRLSDLAALAPTRAKTTYVASPYPSLLRQAILGLARIRIGVCELHPRRHKSEQLLACLERIRPGTKANPLPPIPLVGSGQSLLIAPGYGSPGHGIKAYPHYLELIRLLRQRHPEWPIVLLGGGQTDRDIIAAILARLEPGTAGIASLLDADYASLKACLAGARAVVANDNGLAHLAAMFGRPTLVLAGPTDASYTGPLGEHVAVVCQNLPCQPCLHQQSGRPHCQNLSPQGHPTCLDLPPEQILQRIETLVEPNRQA